jgi:O-antigen ligase
VQTSKSNLRVPSFVAKPDAHFIHVQGLPLPGFVLLHIPLALLLRFHPLSATLHALLVLGVGLIVLVFDSKRGRVQHRAMLFAAYIVGAEVLWRMTHAQVFWEYGKYAVALLLIIALLRSQRPRVPVLVLFYFLLLLPSMPYTLFEEQWDLNQIRMHISFNLSGPLALFVCAWFFNGVQLRRRSLRNLLLVLLAPIVALATIALYSTLTAGQINFAGESNFVTSGGFGPNQVAATMSLGVFTTFLCLMIGGLSQRGQFLLQVIMAWLVVQSLLTFSRTGIVLMFMAMVGASLFLLKNPQARLRLLTLAVIFFLLIVYVIVPRLESFTQGAFSQRYTDTQVTGRDKIAALDLEIWRQQPISGVGPGRALLFRQEAGRNASAHTEFSRLLAEHGALGLIALLLLCGVCIGNLWRNGGMMNRAVGFGLLLWVSGFMLSTAFRLAAPAFVIGLTFTCLRLNEEDEEGDGHEGKELHRGIA